MNDYELLRRYLNNGSQGDFAQLVERHVNLVYSAANRLVRDPHLAEDVTQQTFVLLARKGGQLGSDTILSAWLYRAALHLASETLRRDGRRHRREQLAVEGMNLATPEAAWQQIEPMLDEAMADLNATEQDAVMLRYFENKSLKEVGAALGFSEDAAQKRVSRAVERLREFFAKRGVTVGASGLVVVISANAVQAAPVGLAVTISTAAALAGTTIASTATATAVKTITMTTLQKTLVTATVAILAGAGIYEARQASQLRDENESLQQQTAQMKTESESLSNRLTAVANSKSLPDEQFNELLRLRGEVGVLRRQTNEIGRFKQENQRLATQVAAQNQQSAQLSAEDDFRLHQMHSIDAMTALVGAVKKFADNHGGNYPKSFDELKAASDFASTNFAGNLGLNDFVFLASGTVDPQGAELILRNRTPIKDPRGNLIWVYGSVNSGVPSTMTTTALYGN